jgi:predicted negative regulator of RcsB-dependent stress response
MAIDDLLDEHEQGERVRTWLRDNGAGLIGGVVLGLALIWGWQWWQQQQGSKQVAAASHFQAAVDKLQAGKIAEAKPQLAALPDGIYDDMAALALAKAQLDANKRDAAIATLRAVHAKDPAIDAIVKERLARLLIDAGKAREALALLEGIPAGGQVLQVRGDAYHALGQDPQAREAYGHALTLLEVGSPQRNLVELKLAEVGGAPDSNEAHG